MRTQKFSDSFATRVGEQTWLHPNVPLVKRTRETWTGPTELSELVPENMINFTAKTNENENITALVSRYFRPTTLTESNAPIFATFGSRDPRYYISINIKDEHILALIDSGSTRTYVGRKAAELLGDFENSNLMMTAANNNTIKIDGLKTFKYGIKEISNDIETRFID